MVDENSISPRPGIGCTDSTGSDLDIWRSLGDFEPSMIKLSEQMPTEKNVLVIMPVPEHPGWFYGASNFKLEPGHEGTWKFLRSYQEIIDHGIFDGLRWKFGITLDHIVLGPGIYERFMNYPGVAAYHSITEFREKP